MRFYLKKIGFYLVALFAALTLNFAIPRLMPGDPVSAVLTRLASRGGTVAPETREAITAMLGQDGGNIFQQYIGYLKNILRLQGGDNMHGDIPQRTHNNR